MNTSFDLLRALFALIFVLGMLWMLGYVMRRYGARWGLAAPMTPRADRRMKITEVLPLDSKNRLFLISRDDTHHLLAVGPEGTRVIERNIETPSAQSSHGAQDA